MSQKMSVDQRLNSLDTLSEHELETLLKDYKYDRFPVWRRALLFVYHGAMFGALAYYTINCKSLNKRLFNLAGNYNKMNIFKIGTLQSLTFTTTYILGGYLATGMNPFEYFRTVNKIQDKLYSPTYKHDKGIQEALLYSWLKDFNLPDKVVEEVRLALQKDKQELISSGKLSQKTIQMLRAQISEDDSVLGNMLGLTSKQTNPTSS